MRTRPATTTAQKARATLSVSPKTSLAAMIAAQQVTPASATIAGATMLHLADGTTDLNLRYA